ncbi:MAG: hypothetical protein JWO06_1289, partial [Bacteroidota bacterium]|nr:hypothetical protein [Bacteroidota bacterium]
TSNTNNIGNSGISSIIKGNGDNNTTLQANINDPHASATNLIMDANINGNNAATNNLINGSINGDNATNGGLQLSVDGNNGNNTGATINVGQSSTTGTPNNGLNLSVQGSTLRNQGINAQIQGDNAGNNYGISTGVVGNNVSGQNFGFISSATGTSTGNFGASCVATGSHFGNVGTNGLAYGNSSTLHNSGAIGQAYGSSEGEYNFGVYGRILSSTTNNAGSLCYGVYGTMEPGADGAQNFGVCGDLGGMTPVPAAGYPYYAVYGIAPYGTGSPTPGVGGGGNSFNSYAGYFEGDVFCSNMYYYSDPKLKENITSYSGALDQLNRISVKNYTFKTSQYPKMNLPEGSQIGVLSTDLKEVFPNLVKSAKHPGNGKEDQAVAFEAVNYNSLIPVLIAAVKELDAKTTSPLNAPDSVSMLKTALKNTNDQIAYLQQQINDLCNGGCANFTGSAVPGQIENKLYQNTPNPFSSETKIGYTFVSGNSAQILINNLSGQFVKEVELEAKGNGSTIINAGELSSGTYTYSMIVDGQIIDTKLMVVATKK